MFKRICQSIGKEVTAYTFGGYTSKQSTSLASQFFLRQHATANLSNQPQVLNATKVSISRPDIVPIKTLSNPEAKLQMGFARKPGLAIPYFPISHSAICFYDQDSKKYVVLGRQSPFALNLKDWNVSTRVDNEGPYLADGYHFDAIMTEARFSEQEIQQMINNANQNINEAQTCDMARSNCYSNATFMMSDALDMMAKRQTPPTQSEVESVLKVISLASQDNLSIGVLNNKVVTDKMAESFKTVRPLCSPEIQQSTDEFLASLSGSNQIAPLL